tara:strand:+ start:155 stop:772 length:618 start_codon:yes stop_codon:yes gene_type:complete
MNELSQNSKLKKTSKYFNKRVYNFGIVAGKSKTGEITCPLAGKCLKYCYAQKGTYSWSNVEQAFERRFQLSKKLDFVEKMMDNISRKKADYIRVHDSGDYYSKEYLLKWLKIAKNMPNVRFYSYTNNVNQIKKLYKKNEIPENFDFIFSDGGKQSHLIDKKKDRHSAVFLTEQDLKKSDYKDAHNYDLYATKWYNKSNKVGLLYH